MTSNKKIRLDTFLAENALSDSQEKAKREIIAGWVKVNGETVRDPMRKVGPEADVTVARPRGTYVSRGGKKLARGLEEFSIDLTERRAVDLGASTGGFTDCMLRAGARQVYAVDVGYGQLDYTLRIDPRVTVMERTNARHLTRDDFVPPVDFITADLSFISILAVFDTIKEIFAPIEGVILIKPEFEARADEQEKGVVRDPAYHKIILQRVLSGLILKGMLLKGLTFSPIRGPGGNIEFLLYFKVLEDSTQGTLLGHSDVLQGPPQTTFIEEKSLNELIASVVENAYRATR